MNGDFKNRWERLRHVKHCQALREHWDIDTVTLPRYDHDKKCYLFDSVVFAGGVTLTGKIEIAQDGTRVVNQETGETWARRESISCAALVNHAR